MSHNAWQNKITQLTVNESILETFRSCSCSSHFKSALSMCRTDLYYKLHDLLVVSLYYNLMHIQEVS